MERWKEIMGSTQCFQSEDEPEVIHVIKTGFRNKYMLVHEDAYELMLGKVEFGTREEIELKYRIRLK